jgi:hypothetical protein
MEGIAKVGNRVRLGWQRIAAGPYFFDRDSLATYGFPEWPLVFRALGWHADSVWGRAHPN